MNEDEFRHGNIPMIYTWHGVNIDTLDREQLVDALRTAIKELNSSWDSHQQTLRILKRFGNEAEIKTNS